MDINYQEIRDSFVATSRDILQRSETLLLEMEKSVDANLITELLRGLHTIKGNAGIFELDAVIRICHALETRIEEIRDKGVVPSHDFIDLALTALDKLQSLIGGQQDPSAASKTDYEAVLERLSAPKAASRQATPAETAGTLNGLEWSKKKTSQVRLPDKYFELAKKTNRFLSFVALDLFDQGELTVRDLYEKLQVLHREKSLLAFGALPKDKGLTSDSAHFLPYYLILCTNTVVNERIAELKLRPLICHSFWQPGHTEKSPEAAVPVEPGTSPEGKLRETHLKVSVSLLNNLIEITGEIVLARNALVRKADTSSDQALSTMAKKLSYLVADLQDKVMRTRLQPLGILFQRFPRLVRETAVATGKKAELRVTGSEIELDKAIIDEIADPLVHIIRNAVDHGMESPEVRRRLGKAEAGTITLAAEMREGNIVITVADDGAGLDYERIRNTAVEKGLISRDAARSAGEQEISEYLFLSGFSTKAEVSTISGRGVGMDVVRSNVKSLGGSVEISGKTGEGTLVTLIIPQTLSILTCLIVECAGFRFVVPQQNIVEVVKIDHDKLKTIQSKKAYELRNRLLPLVETSVLIGLAGRSEASVFLVLKTEKYHFGLTVDSILDTEEVVVKSLPHFNDDNQLFAGAAIMGDAQIALILDAAGIGKQANLQLGDADRSVKQAKLLQVETTRHLLFAAAGKQIAFKIFSNPRIERISAAAVESVVGRKIVNFRGEIIPLLSLDFLIEQVYSADAELALIILQSDTGKYGILADEVTDVISDLPLPRRDESNAAEIEGITILGEATVVILNTPYLIERAARRNLPELAAGARL